MYRAQLFGGKLILLVSKKEIGFNQFTFNHLLLN